MAKKLMELVREVLAKGETEEGRRELREQRERGGARPSRPPRRPLRRLQRLRRRPRTCPRRPLEDLTRPKGRLRCGRSSGSIRSSRWWSKLSKKPPSRRPDRGRVGALPPSEGSRGRRRVGRPGVLIDVELPPGSGHGPVIELRELAQLGVVSAPRFRAYIAAHSVT